MKTTQEDTSFASVSLPSEDSMNLMLITVVWLIGPVLVLTSLFTVSMLGSSDDPDDLQTKVSLWTTFPALRDLFTHLVMTHFPQEAITCCWTTKSLMKAQISSRLCHIQKPYKRALKAALCHHESHVTHLVMTHFPQEAITCCWTTKSLMKAQMISSRLCHIQKPYKRALKAALCHHESHVYR